MPRATNPFAPDFGEHTIVFDSATPSDHIQRTVDRIHAEQHTNQFGSRRYALLFAPGDYEADVNLGFYTQVAGLGMLPGDVRVSGHMRVEADWLPQNGDPDNKGNATQNFWRAAENLTVTVPDGELERWAVSQAAPYRRMHLHGSIQLWNGRDGWASGGFIADSRIEGLIESGTQQQFLTRNVDCAAGWSGGGWNMVFVGSRGAPPHRFPEPPHTTVETTPRIREKPFLFVDRSGEFHVFVPRLRSRSVGASWSNGMPAGQRISLREFFLARPSDTAATVNAALAAGRHVVFTPGIYWLEEPIRVTRPYTVVLGIGFATLVPQRGTAALEVSDVDGVSIAGLLVDAGPIESPVLVEIGAPGARKDHAHSPVLLADLFVRIGGARAGAARESVSINSNDVIVDHLWLWRADHGDGVGWTVNPAARGLVVHGRNVIIYGLFVEHYHDYNVLWFGNRGRTYFFQNELPYDPPNQQEWLGAPAYTVADSVTEHEAWGLGSYCFFETNPSIMVSRAFSVPDVPGVRLHSLVTVSLGGIGAIRRIVNDVGGRADARNHIQFLAGHPAGTDAR